MTKRLSDLRIAFIGAGHLGRALIQGLLESGVSPDSIWARRSSDARSRVLTEELGIRYGENNATMAQEAELIILAVKPQQISNILAELSVIDCASKCFVSVAAGIRCAQIESALLDSPRVIRAMPNTPALIKMGATAISKGKFSRSEDLDVARLLFEKLGIVVEVHESQIDLVTGLSGSGPAYVMRFLESMISAGTELGLDPSIAAKLATQTMHGAMALLEQSGDTPDGLRKKVSSPGGTTEAGLKALSDLDFEATIKAAIEAASKRASELGRN